MIFLTGTWLRLLDSGVYIEAECQRAFGLTRSYGRWWLLGRGRHPISTVIIHSDWGTEMKQRAFLQADKS